MKRRVKLAGAIICTLLLIAATSTVIASMRSVSASEAAANAAPLPPGPTTATVEERSLADTLSIRGVITAPTALTVTAPVSSENARNVVTGLPVQTGSAVTSPGVVAEVSGRPIIILQSPTAFFRNLTYGDTGNDVAQLQTSLGVEPTGTFNGTTQDALDDLYESLGYTSPQNEPSAGSESPTTDTLQPLLDALEDARTSGATAVQAATITLTDAQTALQSGTGSPAAVAQAELELDSAVTARDTSVSRAQRDVDAEQDRLALEEQLTGTRFDAGEVAAIPFPSATIISVLVSLGGEIEAGQAIATLGDPTLKTISYVGLSEAQMLEVGMPVSLTSSSLISEIPGTISMVATEPSSISAAGADATTVVIGSAPTQETPFRVEVDMSQQPPSSSVGNGVLLTITLQGTGTEVVAVPAVALQQINGQDVLVTLPDNQRWPVETGFTAEGWVEIRSGAPPVGSTIETR